MCIVFAVYEYYTCIVHLTFWGFIASRQDNVNLFSHGKQEDGTEEEVLHREHLTISKHNVAFSQAVRMGFESAQIQQRKTD